MTAHLRSDGYMLVYLGRRHPLADRSGQAYAHRLVIAVGRELRPGEIVHHRNGRRAANEPENLQPRPRREHASEHARRQRRDGRGRFACQ